MQIDSSHRSSLLPWFVRLFYSKWSLTAVSTLIKMIYRPSLNHIFVFYVKSNCLCSLSPLFDEYLNSHWRTWTAHLSTDPLWEIGSSFMTHDVIDPLFLAWYVSQSLFSVCIHKHYMLSLCPLSDPDLLLIVIEHSLKATFKWTADQTYAPLW